ncbi:MAG TPA: CoA-binding protein [Pirellulales bacterium]|nr:CoA-binding protein [Pirellulales bacterium]
MDANVEEFLAGAPHAVVGASQDRAKYGNKVLRVYQQHDRRVIPVHPSAKEIEGLVAYPDLAALPEPIHGISVITPPPVTERVVQQAVDLGIKHIWMQPGAESEAAVEWAEQNGINVIAGGPCLLVVLGFRDE